jgi:tyrosyl-tRNA synthetase
MSKSTGNYIGVDEPPEEQYGKAMSLPDEAMPNYFDLVTRWSLDEITELKSNLKAGNVHPMEAKHLLAWEIVDIFHGKEGADKGAAHFQRVHQKRDLPEDIPAFPIAEPTGLLDLMVNAGLTPSKSEGRRLIQQGGVQIDGRKIEDPKEVVPPGEKAILQVGKRKFLHLNG